jgi:hypothetical protein
MLQRPPHATTTTTHQALEFPQDDAMLVNGTGSGMQFMLGSDFLVAPQYLPLGQGGDTRDGIYFPAVAGAFAYRSMGAAGCWECAVL